MEKLALDTTRIAGFDIATASRRDLVALALADCRSRRGGGTYQPPRLVFDANGQAVSMRHTDPGYRAAVDEADIIHADGGFLVTASRFLGGKPVSGRSGTTDMIRDFAECAAGNGLSFYLLGGSEEVNALCAERLMAHHPGLRIAGRRHGYFPPEEEEQVIADINRCAPDILWVGLGKPKEQIFSVKWRDRIDAGWLITCGGCFNFVTGHYRRAPEWMQRTNLEWLHRMVTNPRKLFWRYVITNPHALFITLFRSHV